jgi:hypothetical protein
MATPRRSFLPSGPTPAFFFSFSFSTAFLRFSSLTDLTVSHLVLSSWTIIEVAIPAAAGGQVASVITGRQ